MCRKCPCPRVAHNVSNASFHVKRQVTHNLKQVTKNELYPLQGYKMKLINKNKP